MESDSTKSDKGKLFSENYMIEEKDKKYLLKKFIKGTIKFLILKNEIESQIKTKKEIEMATQAKIEDILIPIFNVANFSSWKLRLMLLLEYKECKEQATRSKSDQDTKADWNKKDLKARMIIMITVSDKQLEYIRECLTAYDMMKKFNGIYTSRSTALQILQRGKIEEIKLNNYTEVDEFFVDFEKSINDFKADGGTLDEAEKMRYLIKALPPSYSYIGDFIDVVPEEQRTVDYVKTKIKEKNINKSEVNKRSSVSTFNTKTKGQCFVCRKYGHKKKIVTTIKTTKIQSKQVKTEELNVTKERVNEVIPEVDHRGAMVEVEDRREAIEKEEDPTNKIMNYQVDLQGTNHVQHGQLRYIIPR